MVTEEIIINNYIQQINRSLKLNLCITQWPDKINRTTPEIDAIAESNSSKLAIEHTSIDVLPKQRYDDAKYLPVVKDLSKELNNKFNCRLTIVIKSNSITGPYNHLDLRSKLKNWLIINVPDLPFGKTKIRDVEIPFKFYIRKEKSDNHRISFGRDTPPDSTFESRLNDRLEKKSSKLMKYEKIGFKTIIIVENNDIQLMSEDKIFQAIQNINIKHVLSSIDEIWYADSSIEDDLQFWLLHNRNHTSNFSYPKLLKYGM